MSDQHSPSPNDVASAVIGASGRQSLRCQWCSVPLATGVTICPTCGSAGIPDPGMTGAGLTEPEISEADPVRDAVAANGVAGGEVELVEWWRNETPAGDLTEEPRQTLDFAAVERRRMQSMIAIGGAVVVCVALGWLIGPSLLEGPFERLTGTTVENPDDLRTMGTIGGLIVGMFVGATSGWVVWADN